MKTILLAINSKYLHTNPAVRYIKEYVNNNDITIKEFTINQRLSFIVDELILEKPKRIIISTYIWNLNYATSIANIIKRIDSSIEIAVGGPQVSYHPKRFLSENPAIDFVIVGEGEEAVKELMHCGKISEIDGLVYRDGDNIIENKKREAFNMSKLPFAYPDIAELNDRILYFESTRGCPFKCSYCLSSVTGGVRYMPLESVFNQLDIFISHKVKQVKFVDRTFNCSKKHALAIWQYLKENDNGVTNFHFEISADLIDDETLEFLSTVRKELFQFEIGVQSTNKDTLKAINRNVKNDKVFYVSREIKKFGNIHRHLDLIVGLPLEDIQSFENSFNEVYFEAPEQLQLGFLKVLEGSILETETQPYGIVHSPYPPFEVLKTNHLSYEDILTLKKVEDMVDRYYNSGRFTHTLASLTEGLKSPYSYFKSLGELFYQKRYHHTPVPKERLHSFLREHYNLKQGADYSDLQKELALFDICLHEKPNKIPDWIDYSWRNEYKDVVTNFFLTEGNIDKYLPHFANENPKRVARLAHIQVFSYNPITKQKETTFILFDYENRDLLGNAIFHICNLK